MKYKKGSINSNPCKGYSKHSCINAQHAGFQEQSVATTATSRYFSRDPTASVGFVSNQVCVFVRRFYDSYDAPSV